MHNHLLKFHLSGSIFFHIEKTRLFIIEVEYPHFHFIYSCLALTRHDIRKISENVMDYGKLSIFYGYTNVSSLLTDRLLKIKKTIC